MAMELHVLSDRGLSSIAEWQHAIDAESFPLRLANDVDLPTARGMLPALLEGKQTGFECYHDNAEDTLRFLGREHFNRAWTCALGLRWGSDMSHLEASWMAATAYAAATGGIIFDHEEARVFTPQQARELVAKFIANRPRIKAMMEEIAREFAAKRT